MNETRSTPPFAQGPEHAAPSISSVSPSNEVLRFQFPVLEFAAQLGEVAKAPNWALSFLREAVAAGYFSADLSPAERRTMSQPSKLEKHLAQSGLTGAKVDIIIVDELGDS